MQKITVIEFCPQFADETREAVKEARQIIKDGGGLYGLPLFFFPCRDQRSERANRKRAKNDLQAVFFFLWYLIYPPTAKRSKMGEKSSDNGKRTRDAQRNTAHVAKISPYKPDNAQATPTTPPTARTPRKRPKKGNGGKDRGRPRNERPPPRSEQSGSATDHHQNTRPLARISEKTVASVVGGFCRQIKKTAVSRQRSWRLKILWRV